MGRLAGFKYREIKKRLKKKGFEFYRQASGSHEIWYNPQSKRFTTIPNHSGDLPEGTLKAILKQAGIRNITCRSAKNTLHALVNNIRVSFLGYKYPLLREPLALDHLKITDHLDIACMKLSATVSRGTKKDFIDVFYLLKNFTLEELFQYYSKKYPVKDYRYILLKFWFILKMQIRIPCSVKADVIPLFS